MQGEEATWKGAWLESSSKSKSNITREGLSKNVEIWS